MCTKKRRVDLFLFNMTFEVHGEGRGGGTNNGQDQLPSTVDIPASFQNTLLLLTVYRRRAPN